MVEEGATTEDITSGYGLLPPVAAAAARQKLASLDAVLVNYNLSTMLFRQKGQVLLVLMMKTFLIINKL